QSWKTRLTRRSLLGRRPSRDGWQPWLLLVELVVEVDGGVPLGIRRTGGSGLLAVALDGFVHLGQHRVGLLIVDAIGQCELAHQDLASLGQHALLACPQPTALVAAPQVTYHLSDLVLVTRGQALLVGLVAARPVTCLLYVRLAQHGEDLEQTLFADDVAHAHLLGVRGRDADGKVTLVEAQHQVVHRLTLELALLDPLDLSCAVVWVYDRVADLEIHP